MKYSEKNDKQKSEVRHVSAGKKKAIIIVLSVIAGLALLLFLLNLIDYDSLASSLGASSAGDKNQNGGEAVVTVDSSLLKEPDYDEDIMLDEDYLKEDRYLHFTYGAETFEIIERGASYNEECLLFFDYFEALIAGDVKAYRALFTDEYNSSHAEKSFTAQKIYNINVTCIGSEYLKNGDSKGNYKGYTVSHYDVQYNIKDNNGSFRNDFTGEDGRKPLIFQTVANGKEVKISNIQYYGGSGNGDTSSQSKDPAVSVMFFVWLGAFVVSALLMPILAKPEMLSMMTASFVSIFLSFVLPLPLQFIVFAATGVPLWLIIGKTVLKYSKKKKISQSPAKNGDEER